MKSVKVSEIQGMLKSRLLSENDEVTFDCKIGDVYKIFGRTMFQAEPLPQDEQPGPKQQVLVRLNLANRRTVGLLGPYKILNVKGRVRWMHAPTSQNPEGIFVMASGLAIPSSTSTII